MCNACPNVCHHECATPPIERGKEPDVWVCPQCAPRVVDSMDDDIDPAGGEADVELIDSTAESPPAEGSKRRAADGSGAPLDDDD